ncbi:hypothetical protein KSX_56430 [Ktedonospora formicarum]|uniref:Uncharacterized protein n=1 Tax=Ktedonospora formicarum TaxID=2778364 RepID=A0A8J3MWD9_9CHLR|nr:hypothetical protein KSX_56430 [Ktedonospora formicarum]
MEPIGYGLAINFPPLIFTQEASFALTLSLLRTREQGFAQTSAGFEGVLAKVMRVLPEATRRSGQWSKR